MVGKTHSPERKRPRSSFPLNERLRTLVCQYAASNQLEEKKRLQFRIRKVIQQCDERNVAIDLSDLGVAVYKLDLSNLIMKRADFERTEWVEVKFEGSDLTFVSFRGRDRKRRNTIKGCIFDRAICLGTDFECADLRGSSMDAPKTVGDAKFKGSRLDRSLFEQLLPYAKPTGADISLDGISLEEEDLSGLKLLDYYLRGVYFRGANLSRTEFGTSDIGGSDLKKVMNFHERQIEKCSNRSSVIFDTRPNKRRRVDPTCREITDFFQITTTTSVENVTDSASSSPSSSPTLK